MDYGYIYLTTNMLNGVSYIGMSRSPVFNPKYFGSGVHLKNALRKYGRCNFSVVPLLFAESEEDLCFFERTLIQAFRDSGVALYNISDGGDGSSGFHFTHSDEARKKIGDSKRGRHNDNISAGLRGKPHSEESRRKQSETCKKRWEDPEFKARMLLARKNGKKRSPCSEETKKKISEGNKKANHSERWTSEMREAQRRRFCINVLKRGESE